MPKTAPPKKSDQPMIVSNHIAHTVQPWSCIHHKDKSEIEAYIVASGKREVIAEVRPTLGHSAEAIAEFIISAVNIIDQRERLINEMTCALELCLECSGGLNWAAENEADLALRHAKERA